MINRPSLYLLAIRGLSHELRNALTAVSGFSDLLQTRLQDDTDLFMLKQVKSASVRIQDMLEAVTRFAIRPGDYPKDLHVSQSVQDAWALAVWQHRGNLAPVRFLLSGAGIVSVGNMAFHDALLMVFGEVLLVASHTAPVDISVVTRNDRRILQIQWTTSPDGPGFQALCTDVSGIECFPEYVLIDLDCFANKGTIE